MFERVPKLTLSETFSSFLPGTTELPETIAKNGFHLSDEEEFAGLGSKMLAKQIPTLVLGSPSSALVERQSAN